ncbi:DNA translocase FtsK [Bacillus piscicola]|uniref:DNA translocase FtsK n=1 Tax=Bacillus piscicola TaxID=1632684 RepID=UPI001F0932BF|nr:DNA translocase FtsK [Bacillus piscicola]
MAGSFQHIITKVRRFLFGEEYGDTGSGKNDSLASSPSVYKGFHEKAPRVISRESTSVKMVHHYPKQEYADKEELSSVFNNEHEEHLKVLKKEEEPPGEAFESKQTSLSEKWISENWELERSPQNYFQGSNFAAKDIPSPVFGFEKAVLHPDSLKRKSNSIHKMNTEKNDHLLVSQERERHDSEESEYSMKNDPESVSSSDKGVPVEKSREQETEREERTGEATTSASWHSEKDMDVRQDTANGEEEEVLAQKPPMLNRKERRRQEAAERKNTVGDTKAKQADSVPYNVLMYPAKNKKNSVIQSTENRQSGQRYQFPSLTLLKSPSLMKDTGADVLLAQKTRLEETLHSFNVKARVTDVTKGPAVTRFEVQPEAGVKVNKITNLADDLKLALAAKDLRMEAPIPGKKAIGIEVPNLESKAVLLSEILKSDVFTRSTSPLTVAMGLDISGNPVVADLQKMPHGLIAGATGSGKSVCINSVLLSLLYKARPDEVKLILIDPKMVELASYKDVPHLVTPVINDAKEATAALKWAVEEMDARYEKLAHEGVRDIKKYNEQMVKRQQYAQKMPYIVIIIDELADLMMVSPQEVEEAICRIAQKARACGIHLLLATQRPSVDVITGLIKANIPSRTAFAVSSQADSRTILDIGGAERLIGKGDMLFYENGTPKPIRVQGAFVTDEEIDRVTDFVKVQQKPSFLFNQADLKKRSDSLENTDDLFHEACQFVAEQGSASSSLLQRRFSIGYNRAAKLIDLMEAKGIISESMGSKPRRVLMTAREIEDTITV